MARNPANHHQGPAPKPQFMPAHDTDHQSFIDNHWAMMMEKMPPARKPASAPSAPAAAPRAAAPKDPIRSWTNEELVAGEKRQQDKIDNSYTTNTNPTLGTRGERMSSDMNADIARDSSYTIRNEVDRRGRAMRDQARRNNR